MDRVDIVGVNQDFLRAAIADGLRVGEKLRCRAVYDWRRKQIRAGIAWNSWHLGHLSTCAASSAIMAEEDEQPMTVTAASIDPDASIGERLWVDLHISLEHRSRDIHAPIEDIGHYAFNEAVERGLVEGDQLQLLVEPDPMYRGVPWRIEHMGRMLGYVPIIWSAHLRRAASQKCPVTCNLDMITDNGASIRIMTGARTDTLPEARRIVTISRDQSEPDGRQWIVAIADPDGSRERVQGIFRTSAAAEAWAEIIARKGELPIVRRCADAKT